MTFSAPDRAAVDALLEREWDRAYARRARLLLEGLDPHDGERILDCGCGMGFHLSALARLRRVRLAGVDLDLVRLRAAVRSGVRAGVSRSALERLPFPDASFDKVLASEVLEHVSNDGAALAEIHRVLRPGGTLAVSVPHANYPFWWDPVNTVWSAVGGGPIRRGPLVGIWTGHERLYAPAELSARVEGAGFTVTSRREATHYALPFSHLLLYGIGKPLFERGLLPGNLRASADRLRADAPPHRGLLAGAHTLLTRIDALNDDPARRHAPTWVNVVLFARKNAPR